MNFRLKNPPQPKISITFVPTYTVLHSLRSLSEWPNNKAGLSPTKGMDLMHVPLLYKNIYYRHSNFYKNWIASYARLTFSAVILLETDDLGLNTPVVSAIWTFSAGYKCSWIFRIFARKCRLNVECSKGINTRLSIHFIHKPFQSFLFMGKIKVGSLFRA